MNIQCPNIIHVTQKGLAAFNQEKALVGAFSVITNLRMEIFEALVTTDEARVVVICSFHQDG